ncbi:MAG: CHASE2 domain-containing protein [Oscillatoria princeps RMCB-10]|jgi:CHASE2 domain-containing sensor protein|nr:CHASE2 domain-containing protein [Oscillatoria princeps RMCB-10]
MIDKNLLTKIRSVLPSATDLKEAASTFFREVAIASVAVTCLLAGVKQLGTLEAVELNAFDQMIRLRPEKGPDDRLLIVGITDGDIQLLKEPILSDRTVKRLLEKIEQLQPRAIGLDILRDVPVEPGNADLVKYLDRSEGIITVCKISDPDAKDPGTPPPPGFPKDRVGFADLVVDAGGILRRTPFFLTPQETPFPLKHLCNNPSNQVPSFALQVANLYLEQQGIHSGSSREGELMLGSTVFKRLEKNSGGYQKADVGGNQRLIDYRSAGSVAKQVSLTEVLNGKLDANSVRERIVLIGYTAQTAKQDSFYTPYSAGLKNSQKMPGVVAHAQIVSQILSAVLDKQTQFWFWPEWAEVLWIGAWSLVGGTLAWRIRHPGKFALVSISALGVLFATSFGLFVRGGWLPVVSPAIALIASAGSVVLADRFNKAGYPQAIANRVKQVFKVEIDLTKKEREVAEITESETFKELQRKARELRGRERQDSQAGVAPTAGEPASNQHAAAADDYFGPPRQKGKQLEAKDAPAAANPPSPISSADHSSPLPENAVPLKHHEGDAPAAGVSNGQSSPQPPAFESAEDDYLQQLRSKAKKLKHRDEKSGD